MTDMMNGGDMEMVKRYDVLLCMDATMFLLK